MELGVLDRLLESLNWTKVGLKAVDVNHGDPALSGV